jgi:cell division protein FtsZ
VMTMSQPTPELAPLPDPTPLAEPVVQAPGPIIRPARLPQIEDFPVVAQQQLRAAHAPQTAPIAHHEAKRMTLLQRLAAVGLGRREEVDAPAPPAPSPAGPPPEAYALPPEAPRRAAITPQPARSAAGQLDSHGRQPHRSIEDDQLEIPAFLRRQVS